MESKMQERYDHLDAKMEDIGQRVATIIAKQYGKTEDEINGKQTFKEMGDSLDFVQLIMVIEEEFDVEVPDRHAENFKTLSDLFDYVLSNN